MIIKNLGLVDYQATFCAMKDFTDKRDQNTPDEIWICEHKSVFTQGLAGKAEHILHKSDIPIIPTDRGGQVTYHGPGQLIIYPLLNLKARPDHLNPIGIRALVSLLEQATLDLLKEYNIDAYTQALAPGIYVDNSLGIGQKIASLGLRVRKNCSYHGIAININCDLSPFDLINPCGYVGLKMINLATCLALNKNLTQNISLDLLGKQYLKYFLGNLS
ncbi:lipoate-protein ligase B [Gammaproteobacteria bacterium]|nr:lipoate-protein ligase B [Gammaproteobacteria bacterium]